jgi:aromatic ring-opening dioxygenase catalytic subunit (LigB family)
MAELVAAFCASHAPLITAAPETADPGAKDRLYAGMAELRRELEAARPTVLVICSNEHFSNFFLDNFPPFCVGIGDANRGPVENWLRVDHCDIPGHRPFGTWLVKHGYEHGFDLSFSEELQLDHGVMTMVHLLTPNLDLPIVPIIMNCAVKPMPTLRRAYQLGAYLRLAIDHCPADERVAILGAGGISHWVGMPGMGRVNDEFDHWFLNVMSEGRAETLLNLTDEEIEQAGNGAHEIRAWLTVAGAMGPRPSRVLAYEPVTQWVTGMGILTYEVLGNKSQVLEAAAKA